MPGTAATGTLLVVAMGTMPQPLLEMPDFAEEQDEEKEVGG